MIIRTSDSIPNDTYFRTGEVEPTINEDNSITMYEGEGSRRSWGAPRVWSNVIVDDCDLIAIHVGFSHKHGGGQFWRYYTTDGSEAKRVNWAQLPDEFRQRVLDAYDAKAPGWAKAPGKLRSQYKKPSTTKKTAYKLVRMDGDAMLSLYDGSTEYTIGKRLVEKAQDEHSGGYYSHPSPEQVKDLWESGALVPERCTRDVGRLALIECEISGTIIKYPNGKMSSTYLTPTRVVETIDIMEIA